MASTTRWPTATRPAPRSRAPCAGARRGRCASGCWAGRAGCAIAHDHKGRLTDSWLAVRFPDGPRYDLGLLELALTPILVAVVTWVARHDRRPGMITGALAVAYAILRFPLDFLRATDLGVESDPRHFGLTPAQWACFLLLGVGAWVMVGARDRAPLPVPA